MYNDGYQIHFKNNKWSGWFSFPFGFIYSEGELWNAKKGTKDYDIVSKWVNEI